jgi:hypothetical protein
MSDVALPRASLKPHAAGQVCPVDYIYSPIVFWRAPDFSGETLYVVDGLHGNLAALDQVEKLATKEPIRPTIVFTSPSPYRPLYGMERDGLCIDASAVEFDRRAFLERFLARRPQGSPAHAPCYRCIVDGPGYTIAQARVAGS